MVKRVALYGVAAIVGVILGLSSALYWAGLWPGMKPLDFGNVEIAGWRSDFAIGSEAADPYTRARVARHGLLALGKSEAVYFTKTTDKDGQKLRGACTYTVSGGPMPAGWWSITLYDGNSLLPMNDDAALSADATNVTQGEEGRWSALIGPQRPQDGADWISNRGADSFDLTLRLYMPSDALLTDPQATLTPPVIERLSCKEASE